MFSEGMTEVKRPPQSLQIVLSPFAKGARLTPSIHAYIMLLSFCKWMHRTKIEGLNIYAIEYLFISQCCRKPAPLTDRREMRKPALKAHLFVEGRNLAYLVFCLSFAK